MNELLSSYHISKVQSIAKYYDGKIVKSAFDKNFKFISKNNDPYGNNLHVYTTGKYYIGYSCMVDFNQTCIIVTTSKQQILSF